MNDWLCLPPNVKSIINFDVQCRRLEKLLKEQALIKQYCGNAQVRLVKPGIIYTISRRMDLEEFCYVCEMTQRGVYERWQLTEGQRPNYKIQTTIRA